jgi:hypothetical protein
MNKIYLKLNEEIMDITNSDILENSLYIKNHLA